ncbi:MAG: SCO1664 family protein [Chloroflexi bacterium]|nr:SCO1664 family protein [Chloroflexota bacterium]
MTLYQDFDQEQIASGPHDVTPADQGAEDFVRTADIGNGWLHPRSSNYTFVVELTDGPRHGFGVYKPERGEAPLWDFPSGLYRRECAAFELAKLLGWALVPPTVEREGEAGIGSLQLFVSTGDDSNFFTLKESHRDQLFRMAVFDMLANNADRKGGHCFLGPAGELLGVDHGLTFHIQNKLRTVIWDFAGSQIPDTLLTDVKALQTTLCPDPESTALAQPTASSLSTQPKPATRPIASHPPTAPPPPASAPPTQPTASTPPTPPSPLTPSTPPALTALTALISQRELAALCTRVETILADPTMPHPYSRHDIPYPPL